MVYRSAALAVVGVLAFVGALSLACFTKAVGIGFLGRPRTDTSAKAKECSTGMIAAQLLLTGLCIALGVCAPSAMHWLQPVVQSALNTPTAFNPEQLFTIPQATLLSVGALSVLLVYALVFNKKSQVQIYRPWDCGFGDVSSRAEETGQSFCQPIGNIFKPLLQLHVTTEIKGRDKRHFPESIHIETFMTPFLNWTAGRPWPCYKPSYDSGETADRQHSRPSAICSSYSDSACVRGDNAVTITLFKWFFFSGFVFFVPLLLLGTIRKIKARLQTRVGAPVTQPLWDVIKLLRKGETISGVATWIFRSTAAVNLVVILIVAAIVPWTSIKPVVPGADFFLVVYLFALSRFFTVLSALDAGSAFGGFAASREVTIALLVEPAIVLCLAALGCAAHTSDLSVVFSMGPLAPVTQPSIWFLAGCALFLSSLVELSRMPVDDPTTHLELTMVHEAMILENSGKNLALTEYASCLKMAVMLGLCGQCFLHAVTAVYFMRHLPWMDEWAGFRRCSRMGNWSLMPAACSCSLW